MTSLFMTSLSTEEWIMWHVSVGGECQKGLVTKHPDNHYTTREGQLLDSWALYHWEIDALREAHNRQEIALDRLCSLMDKTESRLKQLEMTGHDMGEASHRWKSPDDLKREEEEE